MIIRRAAVGLTIWLTLISGLWLSVLQYHNPERLDMPLTFIGMSAYPLMALRWGLVLTLLIRRVKRQPLRLLPRVAAVQVTFVAVMQAVLGVLSLVGFLMIWINTLAVEHVIGVVLHLAIPAVLVLFLARGSHRDSQLPGSGIVRV
jgi:hypothetical protein